MEPSQSSSSRYPGPGTGAGTVLESNRLRAVLAPWWMPPSTALAAGLIAYALAGDRLLRLVVPLGVAALAWAAAVGWRRLRPLTFWRLSASGLQWLRGGRVMETHTFSRDRPLTLLVPDLDVLAPAEYGATKVGSLCSMGVAGMGLAMFPFHLTARRLGAPVLITDRRGDASGAAVHWETVFARREAALLAAAAEGPLPVPAEGAVDLTRPEPGLRGRQFGRRLVAVAGAVIALLVVAAGDGATAVPERVALLNALGIAVLVLAAGSVVRLAGNRPARWTVTPERVIAFDPLFGTTDLPAERIAGLVAQPLGASGAEGGGSPALLQIYGHDLALLGTAHSGRIPVEELFAVLRSRGYRVIEDGPRSRAYDLRPGFLPHQVAPDAVLTVTSAYLRWEGATTEIRVQRTDIGSMEINTRHGHPWLRLRGEDGTEQLNAPLSALRISRTELRDRARAFGYPLADPEYDVYQSAAYAGLAAGIVQDRPALPPAPAGEPAVLDMPWSTRKWYYIAGALSMVIVVGVIGFKMRYLSGGMSWLAWGLPTAVVAGALFGGLYDLRRPGLALGPDGIRLASRGGTGRTRWEHLRATIGGIGVDTHEDDREALFVWSPTGQVIRRESFDMPDTDQLRQACEKAGLPYGRPDPGRWGPPPEI
ncbi:hypothetical protein QMK19_26350 [Streptomyces sp. H10-C2]|uniref:hypothetical protein n=1 Tax=unclassified Streptomyces TaxID=2593676 RepID=UPI0024BB0DF8|nr:MULTISPECIES: hypothetical protein [unclassified Streptomyces]MDJ0344156.1 hypothetical protein [Streptomyces sp. PH10-H1]MDJ0373085.1 hypothetical protein [Streptomyces sp. H10-C2]